MAALAALASPLAAQQRPVSTGARVAVPSSPNLFSWERGHGFNHRLHGGFGGVWVVERPLRQAQDEREIVREVVREVVVPAPAPPAPRKPYVIGNSYASLPGGCMKLIEEGTSFYYCSGEWYREVRAGRDPLYRAVARKL